MSRVARTSAPSEPRGVRRRPSDVRLQSRYLYWEEPDEPWDSGWRVFVGDETQADVDEPSNFQMNALETLLAEHPALESLFVEGKRGGWEWDPQLQVYRPAADPQA